MISIAKPNLIKRRALGLVIIAAAAALLTLFTTSPASATLTYVPNYAVQQTNNDPCVIGNTSCGPLASSTLIYYQQANSPGTSYILFSPNYLAGNGYWGPNRDTVPLNFSLGIDENLATSSGDEVLQYWDTYFCSSSCGTNTTGGDSSPGTDSPPTGFLLDTANSYMGPQNVNNFHNGNGFSDAILTGFSLNPNYQYYFKVSWSNDTDGMEQFFIIPGSAPPPSVPEPGSLGIFGAGLVGLGFLGLFANRRRRGRV